MMRNTLSPLASNDLFGVVAHERHKEPRSKKPGRYGERKTHQHEQDAFTPYESTVRIEASILPVQPSHFRRIPPELAELVIGRHLDIDSFNHRKDSIICGDTESARAKKERGS
jgi:hypothetical protein